MVAMTGAPRYSPRMTWLEVCRERSLRNLPFKVELDRWGRIVMSPHRKEHGAYQGEIASLLKKLRPAGRVVSECAIDTTDGTKVADVAWVSVKRWRSMTDAPSCSIAPEICVEVLSESNSEEEIDEKRELYFEAGSVEVWVCNLNGKMQFFAKSGRLQRSVLCPQFPHVIKL